MPIRFACEECGQKLSARSRQVGHVAKCPKCKHDVTVPASSTRSSTGSQPSEPESPGEAEDQDDLYSQFVVYDDDAEWVYEDETEPSQKAPVAVTIERVSIPRNILYIQGVLLALVAIVAFVFGVLVGSGGSPKETAQAVVRPCTVVGHVHYLTQNGAEIPDEGAVVIVVPKEKQPNAEQRAAVEGLRPSDPLPREDHPALRAIRMLGGAYTRTDENGDYDLRLPAAGEYFVLVLSGNRYRDANEDPVRADLAEIGGYFLPATVLLGNQRYEWRSVPARAGTTLGLVVL